MNAFIPSTPVYRPRSVIGRSLQKPAICAKRPAQCSGRKSTAKAVVERMKMTSTDQMVDKLLLLTRNTDRGARVSEPDRNEIEALIMQLAAKAANRSMITDKRLYDDYAVLYSAPSSKENSPPVGGLLRTPLGKLLFRTRALFENFVQPNTVVNLLCFRFLGIIGGAVSLRGQVTFSPDGASNSLCFQFEQPRLRIGPAVFAYGPKPRIATTVKYLDDRIRITIGRRGSMFVFARRQANEMAEADEWKYIFNAKPLPTIILPLSVVAAIATSMLAPIPVRIGVFALVVAASFILRTGGADRNPSNMTPSGKAM